HRTLPVRRSTASMPPEGAGKNPVFPAGSMIPGGRASPTTGRADRSGALGWTVPAGAWVFAAGGRSRRGEKGEAKAGRDQKRRASEAAWQRFMTIPRVQAARRRFASGPGLFAEAFSLFIGCTGTGAGQKRAAST